MIQGRSSHDGQTPECLTLMERIQKRRRGAESVCPRPGAEMFLPEEERDTNGQSVAWIPEGGRQSCEVVGIPGTKELILRGWGKGIRNKGSGSGKRLQVGASRP